jgi:RNA polymerase sigma-B factor
VKSVIERLTQRLGRAPTPAEVAADARVTVEDVLEALDAGANYRPVPLLPPGEQAHGGSDDEPEGPTLGVLDRELDLVEERVILSDLVTGLDERERTILRLRYHEGLTQSEIAVRVGVSQVHVSRLLRQSLERCRRAERGPKVSASDRP